MSRTIGVIAALWLVGGISTAGAQVTTPPGELTRRQAAVHILDRLGFGPRPGDVDRVLELGLAAYIDAQLHPERLPDEPELERRLAAFETLTLSPTELFQDYPLPGLLVRRMRMRDQPVDTTALREAGRASYRPVIELAQARLTRILYSERQLQEVMVDFWLNHFNVFAGKGPVRHFLIAYEQEVIRPRALGDFRDLLGAVARSPAMLFYLDNWMSAAPETAKRAAPSRRRPRRVRGLNENYARELLELHTLGVDGGYSQRDVEEVARAFTGWSLALRTGGFVFRPAFHDAGPKTILGHELPAGGGIEDGERVLDILARHPSTARFLSEKLARRFVSDEPPRSLVDRAARVYLETDGDIREVVRTIVTSPELFSTEAYRAKTKTPLEWLTSGLRGLGAEPPRLEPLARVLRRLEQPLYGAREPTGYPDRADAWISSGALLARAEIAGRIGRVAGDRMSPRAAEGDPNALVDGLLGRLLPETDTDRLAAVIRTEIEESDPASRREAVALAVSLTLAAPEFQRR